MKMAILETTTPQTTASPTSDDGAGDLTLGSVKLMLDEYKQQIYKIEPPKPNFLESKRDDYVNVSVTDNKSYRGKLKEILDIGLVLNVVDRDVFISWTYIKEVY